MTIWASLSFEPIGYNWYVASKIKQYSPSLLIWLNKKPFVPPLFTLCVKYGVYIGGKRLKFKITIIKGLVEDVSENDMWWDDWNQ